MTHKQSRFFKILLYLFGILVLFVLVFFFILYFVQTSIVLAQKIDYWIYQNSGASAEFIQLFSNQNLEAAHNENLANSGADSNKQNVGAPNQKADTIKESAVDYGVNVGPRIDGTLLANKENIVDKKSSNVNQQTSTSKKKIPPKRTVENYHIVIPKIGVNTKILTDGSLEKRMYKGVAIVNKFATPPLALTSRNKSPTILVSHRFGYVWWTPSYRRTNSFHNIDKLRKGDEILIRWDNKLYKYKVTKTEVSTVISDYNHKLILYSCVSYTSKKRLIVYADLL